MAEYDLSTATIDIDDKSYLLVEDFDAGARSVRSLTGASDRLVEVTDDVAYAIRRSIGRLAKYLAPDLDELNASKATVKFAVKASLKNGKLTSFVSEVGVEGSIEVSIEFSKPA